MKITIPGARLSVPYIDAPPVSQAGVGLAQSVDKDVNRLAGALDEKFQADGAVNAAEKMARARAHFSKRLTEAYANGEIDDNFAANIQDEFAELSGELMEGARNNRYEERALSAGLLSLEGEMTQRALGYQTQVATARRINTANDTLNNWGGIVFADPTQYEQVIGEAEAFVKSLKVPAEAALQFEGKLKGIGEQALRGLIERKPEEALRIIEGGAKGVLVDADRLPILQNAAQAAIERRKNDIERAQAKSQTTAMLETVVQTRRWQAGQIDRPPEITPELVDKIGTDNALRYQADLLEIEIANNKKHADLRAVQSKLANNIALDPKNTSDKNGLDDHYTSVFLDSISELDAKTQADQKVAFAVTFGMIPETLKGEIRGQLRSQNQQQVLAAADLVAAIRQQNHRLLDDMAKDDVELATRIHSQTALGVSPEKALQNVREYEKQPETVTAVRKQEAKSTQFTTDDEAIAEVRSAVNGNASWLALLGGEWKTAATVSPSAVEEYKRLKREEFMRSGDVAAAQKYARETLQRTWDISMMSGRPTVTKYAPERLYGSPQLSPAENWKWINSQLRDDLKAAGVPAPDAGTLILQPHPSRKSADGRPVYGVVVQTTDAAGQPKYDVLRRKDGKEVVFVPDITKAPAEVQAVRKEKVTRARDQVEFEKRTINLPRGLGL